MNERKKNMFLFVVCESLFTAEGRANKLFRYKNFVCVLQSPNAHENLE
jgi:hypothetical protein